MELKARLEILTGPDKETSLSISGKTTHLGRSADNDVIVDDKRVSRHHAHIAYEEGSFLIIDLDTANGTFVNKKRVRNQKLRSGDMIQLGGQIYRFVLEGEHPPISPQSSGLPHREFISKRISPSRTERPVYRMALFGLGIFLTGVALWIMLKPSPQMRREIAEKPLGKKPMGSEVPFLEKEAFNINEEKANQFYESGYREFVSKNYLRAVDDFKTALELYPDHSLARLYLQRTEEMISEEVDTHYKAAINYFTSAHYQLSIFHFGEVIKLLEKRRPSAPYCAEREERQPALENPDYEKYCDAKQKIVEAQAKISAP